VAELDERERLQALHLALEAALEQLTRAQELATRGTEIGAPPSGEVLVIERALGELVLERNRLRERLMKLLGKPTLNVVK
jgi:hypothetical protein